MVQGMWEVTSTPESLPHLLCAMAAPPYNNSVDKGGTVQSGARISVPVNDTGLVLGVSPLLSLSNTTVWFAAK